MNPTHASQVVDTLLLGLGLTGIGAIAAGLALIVTAEIRFRPRWIALASSGKDERNPAESP